MLEHRPIFLSQNVTANVNARVSIDAEDVCIERRVVNLAEPKAIWNDRLAARMLVPKDVRGVEQVYVL